MEKFFGGNPLAVFLRLVIISIVVGIVLKTAGYDVENLLAFIPNFINAIYEFIRQNLNSVVEWLVLGAVVVVPIWVIVRVVKFVGGGAKKGDPKKL